MSRNKKSKIVAEVKESEESTGQQVPSSEVLVKEGLVPERKVYNLAQAFAPAVGSELTARRLSMPPIIKPKDIGPGVCISGLVTGIIDSPVSTYKSQLLVMKHHSGMEFCLPITAAIRTSLERGSDTKDKSFDYVIGSTLFVKGMGSTKTASGRDVNLFEVFIVEATK